VKDSRVLGEEGEEKKGKDGSFFARKTQGKQLPNANKQGLSQLMGTPQKATDLEAWARKSMSEKGKELEL
jgi:hypothetical protein